MTEWLTEWFTQRLTERLIECSRDREREQHQHKRQSSCVCLCERDREPDCEREREREAQRTKIGMVWQVYQQDQVDLRFSKAINSLDLSMACVRYNPQLVCTKMQSENINAENL